MPFSYAPSSLKNLAKATHVSHRDLARRLGRKNPRDLDTLVHSWHDDLFEKGDCLECGNCCRTLGPRILPRDVGRLADFLGVSTDEVTRQYLRIDKDGDLVFSSMPCPFLEEDNHCSVYDARPRACREYPHMDQKKIHKHLNLALKNRLTCPVVYEIFIRLAQRYPQ